MSTPPARPTITGMVTTFNVEDQVEECLASLAWCDELLVVDSYSTDRTLDIVRDIDLGKPLRVVQHVYHGASAQKNWAFGEVRTDWVFILDADERCTPALAGEIRARLDSRPEEPAYVQWRKNFYLGAHLRFSGVRHDKVARLLRPTEVRYQSLRVHARILLRDGRVADHVMPFLDNPIEHHLVESVSAHLERMRRYGYWGAAQAWRDGKRTGAFMVFLRALWRFLRGYFVQFGFLDGGRGFIFCLAQAVASYSKYSILWGWGVAERAGMPLDLPVFDEEDLAVEWGAERSGA